MYVKVCGLRDEEHIDWAIDAGYDAIGVVACPKSKRYCEPSVAKKLANYARGKIETFVVGLTLDEVTDVMHYFDIVQLYEPAMIDNLAYASDRQPPSGLNYKYFFYDASIGTGAFAPFPDWVVGIQGKLILAGGLTSDNVQTVIKTHMPFGIDVSSGVEVDGVKNKAKIYEFIKAVKPV